MGRDGGPGKRTGLAAFKELSNVSIMAIPGVTRPAVQLALVAHCTNTGASFAVLDVPQDLTKPQDVLAHREKIDSDYAAMYHPWIQIYDAVEQEAGIHSAFRSCVRYLCEKRCGERCT